MSLTREEFRPSQIAQRGQGMSWERLAIPSPRTIEEIGLSPLLLAEMVLKVIYYGSSSASRISRVLCIPQEIVTQLLIRLKDDHYLEVASAADTATGDYNYRLTERGWMGAQEALDRDRYASAIPVTLDEYIKVMREVLPQRSVATRESVERALSHLVLAPNVRQAVMRALLSGSHSLLFGPSGNGKTDILASFAEALGGYTLVPHAIYAHGQVIRIFDPSIHTPARSESEPLADADDERLPWLKKAELDHDARWVIVKTPTIMVAGELDKNDFELSWDQWSRFYQAPVHLKAQGGILIIDDFGRQKITPEEILNRWILPLERGWDYLTLQSGEKIAVPFAITILFSTNLEPRDLMQEAFMRRIPYKVVIPPPQPDDFREIMRVMCTRKNVAFTEDALEYTIQKVYNQRQVPPRACLPRDMLEIITANSRYDGSRPVLDPYAFDLAWQLAFPEGS